MTDVAPSLAAPPPAYLQIEGRLHAIGRKHRLQRFLRGSLLWAAFALPATLAAALVAHASGAGTWTPAVPLGWLGWLIGSAAHWIVRPLVRRQDHLGVARLIESRVGGLHNGLTNALLLARRPELAGSPWLPPLFDEVLITSRAERLDAAVRLRDLRPIVRRVTLFLLPAVIVAILLRGKVSHGWRQLLNPTGFVPLAGAARIVDVRPGDTQMMPGQPLELTVSAEVPASLGRPPMRVVFGEVEPDASQATPRAPLPPEAHVQPDDEAPAGSGHAALRYTHRADAPGRPLRYRVEVGATQSRWYAAGTIREVKLEEVVLRVTAPPYARLAAHTVRIAGIDAGKTPVRVPQGSRVEIEAAVDVAVGGAMLQAGHAAAPLPMTPIVARRRFAGAITVLRAMPLSFLLTGGDGQIIFRLPAVPLVVGSVDDAPPIVEVKWPTQDVTVATNAELRVRATLGDDHGVASSRVLLGSDAPADGATPTWREVHLVRFAPGTTAVPLTHVLAIDPTLRRHGQVLRVQVEATDARDLGATPAAAADAGSSTGPQTTRSAAYRVRFVDPSQDAAEARARSAELRQLLLAMLSQQAALHAQTTGAAATAYADRAAIRGIMGGQAALRASMRRAGETFAFEPGDRVVQKALQMLSLDPAKEAAELSAVLTTEPAARERRRVGQELQARQRQIIGVLQSLIAMRGVASQPPAAQPATRPLTRPATRPASDPADRAAQFQKLEAGLREFTAQQQRVLAQTADLAKGPVDQFDDADRKRLDALSLAQEELDAFMADRVREATKLVKQDMANVSLLTAMMEVRSEVTLAKDALKRQAVALAVPAEENGVELATEITTNPQRWLPDAPDRMKWALEDPPAPIDVPMAELPAALEDLIGDLLEREEDLFDQIEDQNANWAASLDKGAGGYALDGPTANMTAKGVTGNHLPNDNDMNGRSAEGRGGRSQGEFVEESAVGKGGRRTQTRLDPTPFQPGRVKDQGKDPAGGATGGGKLSGQGGEGLEGPAGPRLEQQMQRLAQQQAQLRNAAERLNLQHRLPRYDNFRLTEAIALMRRVEADLSANRYQNALLRREAMRDALETSRLLLGSAAHVRRDTTPAGSRRAEREASDAMSGELPAAWSESLKAYYRKLAAE